MFVNIMFSMLILALSVFLGLSLAFLLSHVSYHCVSCGARAAGWPNLMGHTHKHSKNPIVETFCAEFGYNPN